MTECHDKMEKKAVEWREETDPSAIHPKMKHVGRILKTVIFIACLIGFGYQVIEFCSHFLTYPIVANIEVPIRNSFVLPALTFCNINPVQRSRYCEKYPTRCLKPKDMNAFCTEFPYYCKGNTSNLRIPKRKYQSDAPKPEYRLTESDIIELSQNPSDFDVTYQDGGSIHENSTSSFTRVYFTNANKDFYLCYTTNARYTNTPDPPDKKFEEDFLTLFAFFILSVQPEESFRTHEKHGLRFLIHFPYYTMNPYIKGVSMRPGIAYKIHLKLREENLLPFPYKTDCLDYHALWMKSGKTSPRSQQMCINNCQRIFNKECYGCEKDLTLYLASDKLCHMHDVIPCASATAADELRKNLNTCISHCKKDCKRLKYPYTVEEISETMLEEESLILVAISVDDPEVHVLTHYPQYKNVELFSYIGGFMGCWLGLSIWALAGYLGRSIRPVRQGLVKIHRRVSSRKVENI